VSYETLRKWREGATAPNRKAQLVIAEYLQVDPAVFMHGAPDESLPIAELDIASVLSRLGAILAAVPDPVVNAVSENLAGFARERGAEHRRMALLTLLGPASAMVDPERNVKLDKRGQRYVNFPAAPQASPPPAPAPSPAADGNAPTPKQSAKARRQ
jgi:hypothetical protein